MSDHPFARRPRLPREAYAARDHVFHVVFLAMPDTRPFAGERGRAVWAAVLAERTRTSIDLLAGCLMPDHLHLLVKPGDSNVVNWVGAFKSYTTTLTRQPGVRQTLWQPGFYDRRIRDEREFGVALQYLRENPLRAGLVAAIEDWPWYWEQLG